MIGNCETRTVCTQSELVKRLMDQTDTKDAWLRAARELANKSKYVQVPDPTKLADWFSDPLTEEEAKGFAARAANYFSKDDQVDSRDLGGYLAEGFSMMRNFSNKFTMQVEALCDERKAKNNSLIESLQRIGAEITKSGSSTDKNREDLESISKESDLLTDNIKNFRKGTNIYNNIVSAFIVNFAISVEKCQNGDEKPYFILSDKGLDLTK